MLRWLMIGSLLGHAILSHAGSSLGERELPPLSSPALSDLANLRDPSKNLDPSDPLSHLQKILIPRTREQISFLILPHFHFVKPL